MNAARRARVQEAMDGTAPALLVTALPNVRYLTGFTGSNGQVLICPEPVFFTDGRYDEQSSTQVPDLQRHIYSAERPFTGLLQKALAERELKQVGLESTDVSLDQHQKWTDKLTGIEFIPLTSVVENVRAVKDVNEVEAITRAQRIAEGAVSHTLETWSGGTERELALALEWAIRTGGAQDVSFPIIVATGTHSSLIHAEPRDEPADLTSALLIDIGARYDGYCSDMTRTYLGPQTPDRLREVHAHVLSAVEAACAEVKVGARCSDVDASARAVLTDAGLGEAFGHTTGHSVGLEIHEDPSLSSASDAVLDEGMVITIEPGAYLPGIGGVRVEDLLVVTADGYDNLTSLDRGAQP